MSIALGPILHARPSDQETWRFSVLLALEGVDDPAADVSITLDSAFDGDAGGAGPRVGAPRQIADFRDAVGWTVWTWPIDVPRAATEQTLTYGIRLDGAIVRTVDHVAIPARGHLPRLALVSCNGLSDSKLGRELDEPNAMWRRMRERHQTGLEQGHPDDPSGFHLLVGSGDQIYADQLEILQELDRLSTKAIHRLRSAAVREREALPQYLELYQETWGRPDVDAILSRVPTLFTWDDHDILDGWGSHRDEIQASAAYQGVYAAARKAFLALQLAADPEEHTAPALVPPRPEDDDRHLLQTLSFREADRWLDLVVLDLRSHRNREQVLSRPQWRALKNWLSDYTADAAAADAQVTAAGGTAIPRHLLVVSSIPVVYLRFPRLVGSVLRGYDDDLRDHWEHSGHQGERQRLVMSLLEVHRHARVTLLSGDVHVGAYGRVVSIRTKHRREHELEAYMEQVISSGIVHPPPSGFQRRAIEAFGDHGPHDVTAGVTCELHAIQNTEHLLLAQRNFAALAVDPPSDERARLWVEWVAEDETSRQTTIDP